MRPVTAVKLKLVSILACTIPGKAPRDYSPKILMRKKSVAIETRTLDLLRERSTH